MIFQWTPTIKLAVINVYAHTDNSDRQFLWNTLSEACIEADLYILGGDFNMVERVEDRIGGTAPKLGMARREQTAWSRLTARYGILDVALAEETRSLSNKNYTWNNKKQGQHNQKARLDRVHLSQELAERGGSYNIFSYVEKFSDHYPVTVMLPPIIVNRHPRGSRFNAELLKNVAHKARLISAWRDAADPRPGESWLTWIEQALLRVRKEAQMISST